MSIWKWKLFMAFYLPVSTFKPLPPCKSKLQKNVVIIFIRRHSLITLNVCSIEFEDYYWLIVQWMWYEIIFSVNDFILWNYFLYKKNQKSWRKISTTHSSISFFISMTFEWIRLNSIWKWQTEAIFSFAISISGYASQTDTSVKWWTFHEPPFIVRCEWLSG